MMNHTFFPFSDHIVGFEGCQRSLLNCFEGEYADVSDSLKWTDRGGVTSWFFNFSTGKTPF